MLEAVIFDFDGVIADTPKYYFRHMKEYLKELHTEVTDEDISLLVGHSFHEEFGYLNKKYNLDVSLEKFVEEVSVPARKEMSEELVIDVHLKKLLFELKQDNIPMAIASTNVLKNISFVIEKFEIQDYFEGIITAQDIEKFKPFPDAYLKAIEIIGKNPGNCVAIEDTLIGVQSAQRAGLKAVAIPNKFTSNQDFSESNMIINNFSELDLEIVKRLVE